MSEPTLKERLLAGPNAPAGEFTCPSSGVTVFLRRLTLRERMQVQELAVDTARNAFVRQADLCRLFIADAQNRRLFSDSDEDRQAALDLTGVDADALIEAGIRANGLAVGAAERGKGNSPTTGS